MNTQTARDLLKAATMTARCDHITAQEDCGGCIDWALTALPAQRTIDRLGFSLAAFVLFVNMVEALEVARETDQHIFACRECREMSGLRCPTGIEFQVAIPSCRRSALDAWRDYM